MLADAASDDGVRTGWDGGLWCLVGKYPTAFEPDRIRLTLASRPAALEIRPWQRLAVMTVLRGGRKEIRGEASCVDHE